MQSLRGLMRLNEAIHPRSLDQGTLMARYQSLFGSNTPTDFDTSGHSSGLTISKTAKSLFPLTMISGHSEKLQTKHQIRQK